MATEKQNRATIPFSAKDLDKPGIAPRALVCVSTPTAKLSFKAHALSVEPLCIGRSPGADAVGVDDHRASRRHAEVRWIASAETHAVVDLKSTNGTFLNGAEVERELLALEDVLRIGDSLFVYTELPEDIDFAHPLMVGRSKVLQEVVG
ncbi:MAG: FHA domain-containing protein, partial [Myxococcales bacterium]|nr:FHA domain-containing protein [Myxococcales bacterium]